MNTKSRKLQQENASKGSSQKNAKYLLSMKQRRAIPILIAAPTKSEGARRAGISLSQLNRWFRDPLFVKEYHRQCDLVLSFALASMKGHTDEAVHGGDGASSEQGPSFVHASTEESCLTGHKTLWTFDAGLKCRNAPKPTSPGQ